MQCNTLEVLNYSFPYIFFFVGLILFFQRMIFQTKGAFCIRKRNKEIIFGE